MTARKRGVFISFEGGEGSGKTTQTCALVRLLQMLDFDVLHLREPGGTRIGESIRDILLDTNNTELSPRAELLLYEAARAQIVDQVIAPAIAHSKIVICDRFCDSTYAYQGFGRGLSLDAIESMNSFATNGLMPDRTIYLELPPQLGLSRATRRSSDRIENAGDEFHARVHEGFMDLAAKYPDRFRLVHTCEDKRDTFQAILDEILDLFWELDAKDTSWLAYSKAQELFAKDGGARDAR